jgi:hypothetical protein
MNIFMQWEDLELTNDDSFMAFKFSMKNKNVDAAPRIPFKVCVPFANPEPLEVVSYGTWDPSDECCSDKGIKI